MEIIRQHILSIFSSGVKSVLPHQLIKNNLQLTNNKLKVANQLEIVLSNNVHVIGFGKAALAMTSAVEECLYEHIVGGVISIPDGTINSFEQQNQTFVYPWTQKLGFHKFSQNCAFSDCRLRSDTKIEIFEGANNNLPDDRSLLAAKRITAYVEKLTSEDIILVLISGGGSALLPSPIPPLTLEEKLETIQQLSTRGATIQQLNVVRKQLSTLKGGGLARCASSSLIISLIISDIIGDPIDLIASGPTAFDTSNADDALDIIEALDATSDIPPPVLQLLNSERINSSMLDPLSHVTNIIIGNNAICLTAAKSDAERMGYAATILSSELDGEAKKCGEFLAMLAYAVCRYLDTGEFDFIEHISTHDLFKKLDTETLDDVKSVLDTARLEKLAVCILCGGETTVKVNGNGVGGRNQELVLSSSLFLDKFFSPDFAGCFNVVILSAGTDGIDGPTTAAGAITDAFQKSRAKSESLEVEAYLENNDSNTFYKSFNNGSDLVVTGHTGTNVMDVQIILIVPVVKK